MTKKIITSGILCVFLIVPMSQLSASGLGLKLVGARAFALAGAFRGIADDFSAAYWNPAGMTRLNGFQFGFGAVGVRPDVAIIPKNLTPDVFNPDPSAGGLYGLNNGYTTGETAFKLETRYIPSFAFGYHSEGSSIAYGLSVSIPFGLGTDWDLFNLQQVHNYGNFFSLQYPILDTVSEIVILAVQPTIAVALSEKLSIGVGPVFTYADISFEQPSFSDNPTLGTPLGNFQFPFLITDTFLEGTGTGYGVNVGVMFEASEKLSIGVDVQYFSDIDIDGDVTATTYFPRSQSSFDFITGLLADTSLDAVTRATFEAARGVYSGATLENTSDAAEATLPLPREIGVGIGYQLSERLLISADLMLTDWSSWDEIPININKDFDGDGVDDVTTLVEHWDDVKKYLVGLEYLIMDSDDKQAFLRFGFASDGSPVPDETLGPLIPDIGRKNSIFAGIGLNLGKLAIDVAAQTMFVDDRDVTSPAFFRDDFTDLINLPGTWSLTESSLAVGFGYSF